MTFARDLLALGRLVLLLAAATLLGLLLADVAPVNAATYWVGPNGTFAATGADSSGNEKSLAWANAYATDGDVIRLKPGYYGAEGIVPRAKTTSSTRLAFIGSITGTDPANWVVAVITLDSAATNGGKYITVRGVESATDLNVRFSGAASRSGSQPATSAYDSIIACRVRRNTNLQTVSNVTVSACYLGDGIGEDKFSIGYPGNVWAWHDDPCHCNDGIPNNGDDCTLAKCGAGYTLYWAHRALPDNSADSAAWSSSINIVDNTMNLSTASGSNAIQVYWLKSSTFARNRITLRATGAAGDTHLNTWYDTQDCDIKDNYFSCKDESFASLATFPQRYGLNVRDNQVGNRWVRDTLIQEAYSNRPIKIGLLTSGAHDSTSRNNLWDSNRFRVKGYIEYQARSKGEILRNNVFVCSRPFSSDGLRLGCANSFNTAWNDSVVFKHNTVVSFGYRALPADRKLTNALIAQNLFVAYRNGGVGSTCFGVLTYEDNTTGTIDSNLVWSPASSVGADSTYAVNESGCARSQIRAWGQDTHSRWGFPAFTDSTWDAFDPTPSTGSLAVSTYWPDGYVGAVPYVAADTRVPVVTVTSPTSGDATYPRHGAMTITWSATDDVGVSSVTLDYSLNLTPTSFTTILSGQAASGSYTWPYPLFNQSAVYVRVTAVDAQGNSGSTTVRVSTECAPCLDTDTGGDPNRIPE